ncbi:MAG TPA: recombinase family protein [Phycisphaerae bacterium]|mgnify:CR=1 FL=1|nr:recombinase family protein [Phycisphaerae bacterium]
MNVVIWARVSSREQREGYSIDAQLRAMRDKASREGWKVAREFVVAESAKRGAERVAFNEMFDWVKRSARKLGIDAILSHKLDRVCRNMRDAVRLQELEDKCGVKLAFVDNQFGPGAAGMLSFNVMAAVSQYYSDNLRTEVLKGKDEKVLQGWLPCGAPYGYANCDDRDEPIKPDPEQARAVARIFELYSGGNATFRSLIEQLDAEGYTYRNSQRRFCRTSLSYILNNRFYLGELIWHGRTYPGRHKPLIEHHVFQACQDILSGKNRRKNGRSDAPLAGSLFRCAYCGQSITGERIRRKLRGGGVRTHQYYRCANNTPGHEHPVVRWRGEDLEAAIISDLEAMRFPEPDQSEWFRESLSKAILDAESHERRQRAMLQKRQTELQGMQDRLLNAYLAGDVDAGTFQKKSADLKAEISRCRDNLERCGDIGRDICGDILTGCRDICRDISEPCGDISEACRDTKKSCGDIGKRRRDIPAGRRDIGNRRGDSAVRLFDWSQQAASLWRGSNNHERRQILEAVCLNRTLSDVSLVTLKRKPFDVLVKRPSVQPNRGDKI